MYVYVVYRCVHMCLCGHTCGKGCSCTLVGLRIEIWSLPQSLSTLFTEAGPLSWTPRSLICSLACSGSPPSAFGALGLQVGVTWSRLLHSSWGWTAGITWPGLLHSSWGQKAGPPLGAYTNRGAISSPVHPFVNFVFLSGKKKSISEVFEIVKKIDAEKLCYISDSIRFSFISLLEKEKEVISTDLITKFIDIVPSLIKENGYEIFE